MSRPIEVTIKNRYSLLVKYVWKLKRKSGCLVWKDGVTKNSNKIQRYIFWKRVLDTGGDIKRNRFGRRNIKTKSLLGKCLENLFLKKLS